MPSAAFAAPLALRCSPLLSSALPCLAPRTPTLLAPVGTTAIRQVKQTLTMSTVSTETERLEKQAASEPKYKLALLYDSDCPLCVKEVNFLRRRAQKMAPLPTIKFVDIASDDYSPAENAGIDYETAMGRIHAIEENDRVIVGVQVFRKAYEAVGFGWVYAITSLPGVGAAADFLYNIWADYRLQLTGRPPLEEVMRMRRSEAEKTCR